jgi:presenilin-like A22 family membrane protease
MRFRSLALVGLYAGAQLVALGLAIPFRSEGLAGSSNPNSLATPLYFLVLIILIPIVILLLAKYQGLLKGLRVFILLGIAVSLLFTLDATFAIFIPTYVFLPPVETAQAFIPSEILATVAAVVLFEALLLEPQWYIVDLVGFLAAGALIAILALEFAILPALLLLIGLAIYDAVAVYGTKHMVSLAEVVTEMKLPILMVMPSSASYDYTAPGGLAAHRAKAPEDREALFMGLGDVVFPGLLVVSSFLWLPTHPIFAGVGGNLLTGLGVLAGSLLGYFVLMGYVAKGNPQAGLPLLNGGAIAGYVVTFLLIYHSLGLGLGL